MILLWFCAEDIQMPDSQGTKLHDSPEVALWEGIYLIMDRTSNVRAAPLPNNAYPVL
jgi:hypothetical protein